MSDWLGLTKILTYTTLAVILIPVGFVIFESSQLEGVLAMSFGGLFVLLFMRAVNNMNSINP